MKIIFHKGAHEIGGTCIELTHDGKSILLDLGLPLDPASKPPDLSGVRAEALLVSHPHQDHFGLMEMLSPKVPVYLGKVGGRLIDASRIFRGLAPLSGETREIEPHKIFSVAGFTVLPFLVDHSSPEAFAFLVEAGGIRVFYSGDFRGHGKKRKLFDLLVNNPPRDIDVLIMEGTNLGREDAEARTEEEVQEKILAIIKDQKNVSFLICSGQNIDRITCAWKACRETGKIMVIDLYTAWVLEQMKLVTDGVPNMDWRDIRVLFIRSQIGVVESHPEYFGDFHERAIRRRINGKDIHAAPEKYLSVARLSMSNAIETYRGEHPVNVIYSQWLGYLDPSRGRMFGAEKMASYQNDPGINFQYAHTSGHADLAQLQTFARAINARKVLPVHTECAEDFGKFFDNVVNIADGQELSI